MKKKKEKRSVKLVRKILKGRLEVLGDSEEIATWLHEISAICASTGSLEQSYLLKEAGDHVVSLHNELKLTHKALKGL